MHTTEMGAHSFVHANRAFNFTENVIEMAGLSSRRGGHCVAVHGVAHPDHLSAIGLDAFDQPFQTFVDRLHPKAVHQDQTSRFIVGMQDVHDPAQSIRLGVVTNFDRHGVSNGGEVPHVRTIWIIGAAPIQGKWVERFHGPSRRGTSRVSRRFCFEMQPFVAGKEIHAIGLSQVATSNGFHEGNRVLDFFYDLSVAVGVGESATRPKFQYSGWCKSANPPSINERMKFNVSAAVRVP